MTWLLGYGYEMLTSYGTGSICNSWGVVPTATMNASIFRGNRFPTD